MRALIIDPALRSKGGHHYNAVLRLQRELSKLGIGFSCLGSAYADREVVRDLGCKPTFTKSVYGRDYADAGEFARNVAETGRQLSRALRWAPAADLLILPCCDQVLAMAVARYLKRRRLGSAPHILLWLLYGPHHRMATDDPSAAAANIECGEAFANLRASLNTGAGSDRRLQAHCETPAMAAFYRALLDLDIEITPSPGLVLAGKTIRAEKPGSAATVVCTGFANRPKGYRLLPGAIEHVLQRHRHVTFLVHGIVDGSDAEDEQSTFDRLSALGKRVVVRQDVLAEEEYAAWLARADLVLLPYDRNVYKTRGSGVFTEAQRLGIPVIATEGCAFAQPAFEGGWGVEIADYTSDGVARAALAALGRLEELSARASIAACEASDTLDIVLGDAVDAIRTRASAGLAGRARRLIGRNFRTRPFAIPDA
ncbi:MAG TPA: glycosyltransferase [Reyranella sp.]|jgi:glycosyltransferase involved in cell wall biosynthesis